jgi:Uma2 family endonuclease
MPQTARKFTHISAADYLAAENDGTWRHEFVNGAVYAMAGASDRHNLIRGNLAAILLGHVPEACQVFSAEMKLRIKSNVDERYYYPDIFVSCDPNDRERYTRDSAILVVEVLSPTTERIDRAEKFEAYKRVPSLVEYGLLSQDAIELELFRRRTDWRREFYQRDNTVTLESVSLTLSVSQLYRRVALEDPTLASTTQPESGGDHRE